MSHYVLYINHNTHSLSYSLIDDTAPRAREPPAQNTCAPGNQVNHLVVNILYDIPIDIVLVLAARSLALHLHLHFTALVRTLPEATRMPRTCYRDGLPRKHCRRNMYLLKRFANTCMGILHMHVTTTTSTLRIVVAAHLRLHRSNDGRCARSARTVRALLRRHDKNLVITLQKAKVL